MEHFQFLLLTRLILYFSITSVIWGSSFITVSLYIAIGCFGAISVSHISENMLNTMISGAFGQTTRVTSELFAFFIIGFSIPIFSVVAKLNLTVSGLCSPSTGTLLSVALPWCVSWMFYSGSATSKLLGWGGIIFTGIVAFLAPFVLALNITKKFEMNKQTILPKFITTRSSQILFLYILFVLSIVILLIAMVDKIFV